MKKNTKTTTDMYLAAAFLTCGAKLVGVDYSDTRHVKFTFTHEKGLSEVEIDFDNNELIMPHRSPC